MEKIKLELAKIVGTPSPSSWSQIHTFFPDDPKKLALRGKLMAVVSLQSVEAGIETVSLGREILGRLHEEYFGNLEGGVLERLKDSLEKLKEEWPQTEVVAGVVLSTEQANALYLGILGKGKAVIKRGGSLIELLAGAEVGQVEVGSGLVKAGDVLLLGSSSFFEIVGEGVLNASLSLGNPQEMVESLAPIVLSRTDLSQAAAIICSLVEDKFAEEITSFISRESQEVTQAVFVRKSLWRKIRDSLPKIKRSFYIRQERRQTRGNKVAISVAAVLIFLFLGSVVLGINKKRNTEKEARLKMLFSQAESKYNEAKEAIDLDADLTRSYLEEADKLLEEAKKIRSKRSDEIVFLKTEVEKLIAKTKKDFSLGEISLFFDLNLIKPQVRVSDISRFGNQLAVLDVVNSSLYLLDLKEKSSNIFTDERLREGQKICFYNQWIYVLTKEGILQVNIKDKKASLVIPVDQSWGKILSLNVFTGHLYFLDSQKKTIWQYPWTESGFGSIRSWLAAGAKIEAEPLAMAIDGSIWILGNEGKFLKFVRGFQEKFEIKGYSQKDLLEVKAFYLDEESQNLYLLDPEAKKVIVLAKTGQFKASYSWSGRPDKPDFINVWEAGKKAFLVKDNLIFSFGINESLQ